MEHTQRQRHTIDATLGRMRELDARFRLLLLRRSGMRTRLREHDRILGLATAKLQLDIAQALTPLGAPVYPTDAARRAAFALAAENDLAVHALLALIEHLRRQLDVTDAELTAVRAERGDLRLQIRTGITPAQIHSITAPTRGVAEPRELPQVPESGDPGH
jgi:hypothetical protein